MPDGEVGSAPGRRGEQAARDEGQRCRAGQLLRGLVQRPTELRRRRSIVGIGTTGTLEHGGERTEVGRHRHQLVDPVRQRRDRRVAHERQLPRDRFEQAEAQRVHVALARGFEALRLLGRGELRLLDVDPRGLHPPGVADERGEADVGQPQPAVGAEHEVRGADVAVHETRPMGDVETATGIEADHHHLRRAELTTTVAQVAQAASGEVLADDVLDRPSTPGGRADVDDLGQVRMPRAGQTTHHVHEPFGEAVGGADVGVHDLHRDRPVVDEIGRLEQGDVGGGTPAGVQLVPLGEQTAAARPLDRTGAVDRRCRGLRWRVRARGHVGSPRWPVAVGQLAGRPVLLAHRNRDASG